MSYCIGAGVACNIEGLPRQQQMTAILVGANVTVVYLLLCMCTLSTCMHVARSGELCSRNAIPQAPLTFIRVCHCRCRCSSVACLHHASACRPRTSQAPHATEHADTECDALAQEMLRLLGGRTMDASVMPQFAAYVDGPRRPLTMLEQSLVQRFPRHKLGLRNEEEMPPVGRPLEHVPVRTAWRP